MTFEAFCDFLLVELKAAAHGRSMIGSELVDTLEFADGQLANLHVILKDNAVTIEVSQL